MVARKRSVDGDGCAHLVFHPNSGDASHAEPVLNPAFASNLERIIARYQPALWIHGHMHNGVDVTLGQTRVLANPAGYNSAENPDYDPALCIEL